MEPSLSSTTELLTPEQSVARDRVIDWFKSSRRQSMLTFGGLAGTGKTYTIGNICKILSQEKSGARLAFATMTGKASTVLRAKVGPFLKEGDFCGTIYSLMYNLVGEDTRKRELYFEKRDGDLPYDLIIIDEASMVSQDVLSDLLAYRVPILAVGDHGQLPPVKDTLNIMATPDIRLEKIIRQAEGNPIIQMARLARETGEIPYGDYGHGCIKTRGVDCLHSHQYDDLNSIMLCALNTTRNRMNNFARERLGITADLPQAGEPLICLLNNKWRGIFNGNIGILKAIDIVDEDTAQVQLDMGHFVFDGLADIPQFGKKYLDKREWEKSINYFDWAYCITVWKSQGSEWKNVLLMEEYIPKFDDDIRRRFLYTACTRARERLIIFKR